MPTMCAGQVFRGVVLALLLFFALSCGSDGDQNYLYSVDVINATDAAITVRYDWEYILLSSDWVGKATLQRSEHAIIEWYSADPVGERVEVEYQGIKKLFTVSQLGVLNVTVQDFQN